MCYMRRENEIAPLTSLFILCFGLTPSYYPFPSARTLCIVKSFSYIAFYVPFFLHFITLKLKNSIAFRLLVCHYQSIVKEVKYDEIK
ncbi:hypothetical protein GCM10009111_00180 [Colwellia asteriadis]|uniref:Uncharacterized protein n=1 Tax=Colwellia asteriadis TaxID=517723 RepID=A0ABN1L200_9GAMM